jgi:hypothetical protein
MMKRREFMTLLGGAAAAWPVSARAQQPRGIRRIGALMGTAPNDPVVNRRMASIEKPLQELGWVLGRDIEIHYRWGGGDTDLTQSYAKELIGMRPDVILAHTNTAMASLHREVPATPIVFVMVSDQLECTTSIAWHGLGATLQASHRLSPHWAASGCHC